MEILKICKSALLIFFVPITVFSRNENVIIQNDSLNNKLIEYPKVRVGISGYIILTGKYDISIKCVKGLFINLFYGNRLLDYLHLASTAQEKWYGGGIEYFFYRHKNMFLFSSIDLIGWAHSDQTSIPNKEITLLLPTLGVIGFDKNGVYGKVKISGLGIDKSLDRRYNYFRFGISITLDVGLGISFGTKIKPKKDI